MWGQYYWYCIFLHKALSARGKATSQVSKQMLSWPTTLNTSAVCILQSNVLPSGILSLQKSNICYHGLRCLRLCRKEIDVKLFARGIDESGMLEHIWPRSYCAGLFAFDSCWRRRLEFDWGQSLSFVRLGLESCHGFASNGQNLARWSIKTMHSISSPYYRYNILTISNPSPPTPHKFVCKIQAFTNLKEGYSQWGARLTENSWNHFHIKDMLQQSLQIESFLICMACVYSHMDDVYQSLYPIHKFAVLSNKVC